MTWIPEEFPDRAADVDDATFRLHVEALCWSNRLLLDCKIPKRALRRFAFVDNAEEIAARAVDLGWWQDNGDHWRIIFLAEHQESAEQVERRRLKNRRAQYHKRGRHDLCLPDHCRHALSADDTTDDHADDTADESAALSSSSLGRAGLGRATTEQPTYLSERTASAGQR